MRQSIINICTVVMTAFVLASCAVTDIDRRVNFSALQTYAWGESEVNVQNPAYKGDYINQRIKAAVEDEFSQRGIVKSESNPDFLVSYQTYTEKRQQSYYNGSPFVYGPYFFPYPFGYFPWAYGMMPYGMGQGRSYEYTQGTLVLDITDAHTKEVIWRGTVKGNVDDTNNVARLIRKGVQAILKKYPVKKDQLPASTEAVS